MGYITSNLMTDEQVIFVTKLHWANYIGAWAVILGSAFLGGLGELTWFVWGIGMLMWIGAFVNSMTAEFGVTNKRVMAKTGYFQRGSLDVLLNRVESVGVDQGFLGRLLGYGTIVVGGTGGTHARFPGIARPFVLRRHVNEQIEAGR